MDYICLCVSLLLNSLPPHSGDSDGELLAKFCGQTAPNIPIVVFTPELWVHFKTDASQGDLGFKAKYSFSGKRDIRYTVWHCHLSNLAVIMLPSQALYRSLPVLQSVEAGSQVKEGRSLVLTTPTFTPAPVAVLGCWRPLWATLSR